MLSYREQRNIVTALKRRAVKEFCLDAASSSSKSSVGLFWEKMKPLLPNSKSSIDGTAVCLIEDGKVVVDPSLTFNNYFTSPVIKEPILNLSEEDFVNHTSVVLIRNRSFDLDFSFEQVSSGHIADLFMNLNVKKSCGPMISLLSY